MSNKHNKAGEQNQIGFAGAVAAPPRAGMSWYYQACLEDGRESYELGENLRKSGLLELARGQEYSPKFGRKTVTVQQNFGEYKRMIGTGAAFREWQLNLNPNDRLPRGKFSKGKKPVDHSL